MSRIIPKSKNTRITRSTNSRVQVGSGRCRSFTFETTAANFLATLRTYNAENVFLRALSDTLSRTYLYSYSQIVLLYALVIQGVVNLDVGPGDRVLGTLLKIKRVELVGLRRGSWHQSVKHRRISVDPRAVDTHQSHMLQSLAVLFIDFGERSLNKRKRETETETRTEILLGQTYVYRKIQGYVLPTRRKRLIQKYVVSKRKDTMRFSRLAFTHPSCVPCVRFSFLFHFFFYRRKMECPPANGTSKLYIAELRCGLRIQWKFT